MGKKRLILALLLVLFAVSVSAAGPITDVVVSTVKPFLIDALLVVGVVGGARLFLIVTIFGYKLIMRDYRPMPMWLIKDEKAWRDYRRRHK